MMGTRVLAVSSENEVAMMAIIVGSVVVFAVIAVVADAVRKVLQNREREKSRREIAAYVAEGSISPDDGAKLISAGGKLKDRIAEKLSG
jgi:uncharacterized membrane protein YcjF (UPF0283 family)